ncbi:MAG: hypothetical protein ABI977_31935 [Acidobacteriota bacterium]
MALTSFAQVQAFITQVLQQNQEAGGVADSPHKAFWSTLSYQDFVSGNVPYVDPPMPILVKGDSKSSNIILALQGAIGTPFDPSTGSIGQMPANGPPFFTADQIQEIADWIDAGCPE